LKISGFSTLQLSIACRLDKESECVCVQRSCEKELSRQTTLVNAVHRLESVK